MTDKKRTPSRATLVTRAFGKVEKIKERIAKVVTRKQRVMDDCDAALRGLRKEQDEAKAALEELQNPTAEAAREE